jgi:branched-chain amino acid transport system permease protein
MVGSIIYTFLNAWVTGFTEYWPLTIGLIIMGIVLFAPGGLLGAVGGWQRTRAAKRQLADDAGGARDDEAGR